MGFRNIVLHCGRDVEKAGVSDGVDSQQGGLSTTDAQCNRGIQTCTPADRSDKSCFGC